MICKACSQQFGSGLGSGRKQKWTLPGGVLDGHGFDITFGAADLGFLVTHYNYCEKCLKRLVEIAVLTRLLDSADVAVKSKLAEVYAQTFLETCAAGKSDEEKQSITLARLLDFVNGKATLLPS